MRSPLLCVAILVLSGNGCANWSHESPKSFELPAARASPDSIGLEILFIRLPASVEHDDQRLWSQIDEQRWPADCRCRLADNGFRCGVIGSQMPETLRQILGQQESSTIEAAVALNRDGVHYQRRWLHAKEGRRHPIIASKTKPEMTVLLDDDGYRRGTTFSTARCLFALKSSPRGDGRVVLELTPEIEYGEPSNSWIGREGTFQLQTGLQHQVFDQFRITAQLAPGQTLLLASTPQIKGLGAHFFSEETEQGRESRMLMIRLAHTQMDDLFGAQRVNQPLVTPDRK
jgi:hypothetical protein